MEFNLEAISSALDEILEYHKDIEQLDTFSARSRSSSQRESRSSTAVPSRDTAVDARYQWDAKHLNDSRWGEGTAPPQHTPIQRRHQQAETTRTTATTPTGAVIANTEKRERPATYTPTAARSAEAGALTSPPTAQPLAPRPRNTDTASPVSPSWFRKRTSTTTAASGMPSRATTHASTLSRGTTSVEPLPSDLVNASGLGAAALLGRPLEGTLDEPESTTGKPWVTYYAKNTSPYVVIRCPAAAHPETMLLEDTAATPERPGLRVQQTRDLCVTVQLQLTAAERDAIEAQGESEAALWGTVTVACSREAKRGFVRVAEEPVKLTAAALQEAAQSASPSVSPGQLPVYVWLPVTIPGTLLAPYLRITFAPRHSVIQVTHACRITCLHLQWASTWRETRVTSPAHARPTLQEELDALTHVDTDALEMARSSPSESPSAVADHPEDDAETDVEEASDDADDDEQPVPVEAPPTRRTDASRSHTRASIASHSQDATTSTSATPTSFARQGSYYYDWLRDTFYEGSPSAAHTDHHPAAVSSRPTSSTWQNLLLADTTSTSAETGDSAALAALEAWDACPLWSLAECLAFGQQQAAFFSVAIAYAQDAARRMSLLNLSALPFAFHICALRLRHGEDISALLWLTAINADLQTSGLQFDLVARVMGGSGFLGVVCESNDDDNALPGSDGASALSPSARWVLLVPCVSSDAVVGLLQKCYATATSLPPALASPFPSAHDDSVGVTVHDDRCSLRIVLDWTRDFEAMLPSLRSWSALVPSIQYYGARQQAPLCHFVGSHTTTTTPSTTDSAKTSLSDSHGPSTLLPLLWSGVVLAGEEVVVTLGSLSDREPMSSPHRTPLLSLTIAHRQPFFRVWKSSASPSAPRVVLTDQHVLQSMGLVHGVLATPAIQQLARNVLHDQSCGSTAASPTATSARPRHDRRPQAASEALERFVVVNDAPWQGLRQARGPDAAEALARTTRAWIFHALTTAFRREWPVVGLCLPACASTVDEDALMDTVLHWDYPYPRAVVVFHPSVARPRANEDMTCFSKAGLAHFVAAASLEESLA